MVKSFLEFQSDVAADAGRTFLVLTKEGLAVEQLLEFQIAMISLNDISGVVKLEVKQLDSDVKLCYHLNGLISLANYLRRQRISKSEFTEILDNIISVLLSCNNYLLNDNSFVLKEDFIYIDPKSKHISLIYLPLEIECVAAQEFRSFLVSLLINTATIDTEDNYVQLLLSQIKADGYSLAKFREQLITITCNNCITSEHSDDSAPRPAASRSAASGPAVPKEKEEDRHNSVNLPDGEPPKLRIRQTVLTIAAILSVICAVISTLPVEFRALLVRPDRATAIVYGLTLGGLLAVIAVLTLVKKNRDVRTARQNTSPEILLKIENPALTKDNLSNTETTLLDQSMETSLLADCCFPYLKSVIGEERIVINKTDFTLGRQQGISDYVIPNQNVGRLHAQISNSESKYYITDMDSINGTFINGSRILSNKHYLLNHNDKIALANLEYLFMCP